MIGSSNIILMGFMASGKSHIGAMLAKKLGFSLIDTDAQIEKQQGMSIKSIFNLKGEGYFRRLEVKTIAKLSQVKNSVIVLGGGAPISFDNAQVLKNGHCFYLDISLDVIIKRLQNSDKRPLGGANTADELKKIKELYNFRRPIYENLGHSINVSDNKNLICDEIIRRFHALNSLAGLKAVHIDHPARYPIIFGGIENIDNILSSLGLSDHQPVIITSDHLQNELKEPLSQMVQKLTNPLILCLKDGEKYKNMDSVQQILKQMFEHDLTRKTVVLAVGGGNVGDVAGFLASIFLRGVPFIQIPTTLLAMVDSSIGGKTGVDNEFGKNLIGAFYTPKAVLLDESFLKSLPKDELACGMAEVIKHAIIADRDLFLKLKNGSFDASLIEQALKVKADIVYSDPFEQNIRAYLNLGHTYGHAIEKISRYEIKHGFAVAMGLVLATRMAKKLGMLEEDFLPELEEILEKYHLPTKMPENIDMKDVMAAMKHDKKRDNVSLKLILPQKIGQVCVKAVSEQELIW